MRTLIVVVCVLLTLGVASMAISQMYAAITVLPTAQSWRAGAIHRWKIVGIAFLSASAALLLIWLVARGRAAAS
jgi:hypothetical protein